jgi:hypothetical protein
LSISTFPAIYFSNRGARTFDVKTVVLSAAQQHANAESLVALRFTSPTGRSFSMRTLLWSYVGRRQFPRETSRFEIRHFFS